ncbi:MAG: hypothetical protein JWN38_167 [Candidatus Saccharibacteria bacterium]|nr:hypothetical protein [Candidatus Saccharibacteria bacterium]
MRYGELKPKDLDGNVFTYHLKGLMVDNLVHKNEAGEYSLTPAGRDYIVHRYENAALSAHSIFLIVLKRESRYLLRRRDVQPLIGYTGFVHGEPEAGVDVLQTAAKRLHDKTGMQAVELVIVGSALLTQYRSAELQSYSHAIIMCGETDQDLQIESDATGHNFWADLDSVEKLLPSCVDIVAMIDGKQPWLERSYELE